MFCRSGSDFSSLFQWFCKETKIQEMFYCSVILVGGLFSFCYIYERSAYCRYVTKFLIAGLYGLITPSFFIPFTLLRPRNVSNTL